MLTILVQSSTEQSNAGFRASAQLLRALYVAGEEAGTVIAVPGDPLFEAFRSANRGGGRRGVQQILGHVEHLMRSLARQLLHSPQTVQAMASGCPSPVHGEDRTNLCSVVQSHLSLRGVVVDDATLRTLTYHCVGVIGQQLVGTS